MSFRVCFGSGIFHVRSPGNPVPSSALAPLCSTSLTGQSENESGTNTPLLSMKYVPATGSFNKTALVVSWQAVEMGCVWGGSVLQEPFLLLRCVLNFL